MNFFGIKAELTRCGDLSTSAQEVLDMGDSVFKDIGQIGEFFPWHTVGRISHHSKIFVDGLIELRQKGYLEEIHSSDHRDWKFRLTQKTLDRYIADTEGLLVEQPVLSTQ